MNRILLVLLLLACALTLLAAQSSPPSPALDAQILSAQLEVMRQYDQHLLSTVYWCLATFVTMILAMVGFSWFTNFKVYERDRNALSEELKSVIHRELIAATQALAEGTAQARSALEILIGERHLAMRQEIETRAHGLHNEIQDMRYDFCELRGEMKRDKGLTGNALNDHIQMLDISRAAGRSWGVQSALTEIKQDMIKAGRLFQSDRKKIMSVLQAVAEEHRMLANEIEDVLRQQPPLTFE